MEPRIQYARTKDGVSIAYWTLGEGMPFVYMPGPMFSHVQMEWRNPEMRRWFQRLAEKRMLVRYDNRGSGLSDRDVAGHSLDAHVLDLEAVVDRVGLEKFALLAYFTSGQVAIAYAVHHPERVSHLLLWCSYARGSDFHGSPQVQGLIGLGERDWELYTETLAHARLGWSAGDEAGRGARLIRESTTQQEWLAFARAAVEFDVTALLPQVKSPTLVLHRHGLSMPGVDLARGLASGIPDARLALLEGESIAPYLGDTEAAASAIYDFLGEGAPPPSVETPGAMARPLTERLSARELEVLRLIAAGMSNQQIADELVVALTTVKTHINNIYGKLQARSRTQALARARELNLL